MPGKKRGFGKPFVKGDPRCGRPKGMVPKAVREVREWARAIFDDPLVQAKTKEQAQQGKLPPAIYNELLHFAYGKPKDSIEVTGADGSPLLAGIVRVIIDGTDH